ncbi:TafII-250 protein, partial [Haematococcus lacustris]
MAQYDDDDDDGNDVMGNVLFGNLGKDGKAEIDYLDERAKEDLKNISSKVGGDMLQV